MITQDINNAKLSAISLCMIVKNEEKLLPGCLKSAKDFVDEIVVVDTGSTDRTIEIAKQYGARVYEHTWEDNFSKHRNQSIAYASNQWILYLDADEELIPPSGDILREAIKDNSIDSIAVQIINPFNSGRNQAVFNSVRVFKNHVRFEGIVHNKEVGCENTMFYPIQILHHGYNLNEKKMKAKFDRTTSLLKQQIEQDPSNPMPRHYISASYLSMGAYSNEYYYEAIREAITAIKLAAEQNNRDQIYLCTHYIAAASFMNLGKIMEAEKVCKDALLIFPEHLDSCYLLAKIYERKGDHISTRSFAECYLNIREMIEKNPARFGKIINNSFWGDWLIKIILGKAEYELGAREKAEAIFESLTSNGQDRQEIFRLIGEYYLRKGVFYKAIAYLEKAIKIDRDRLILYMLLECYGQLWDTDNQIKVLKKIIESYPEEVDNLKQIGLIQFERCNYRLASFCLAKVIEMGHGSDDIMQKLKRANSKVKPQGNRSVASDDSLPTISACLIVKNEEDCIERCLKSIRPFVDEIVIVDTGSTDSTLDIARNFGAKIFYHPWEGDFSKHRNQSMSYANGDWLLMIDADEVLDIESGKAMRGIASGTSQSALLFKGVNCSIDGEVRSIFGFPRLFRNHKGCHYRGIVHNQPYFPGKAVPTSLTIYHYGYDLSPEKMAKKSERTINLLRKQVQIDPDAPIPRFNLAISLYGAGKYREVAEEGEYVIGLLKANNIKEPGYGTIYHIVSMSQYYLDNMDKAEKIAMAGLDYLPQNLDALFALTLIYDQKKEWSKTIKYGELYLDLRRKIDNEGVIDNIEYKTFGNRWSVFLCLSLALQRSGNADKSTEYFKRACHEASFKTFSQADRAAFSARIGLNT